MGGRHAAGSDEAVEDARFWGASEEIVAAIETAESNGDVGIWAENWDIVTAFTAVVTQWRIVATAGGPLLYTGLDYPAALAALAAAQIAVTPDIWAGIQTMETAGRAAANRA